MRSVYRFAAALAAGSVCAVMTSSVHAVDAAASGDWSAPGTWTPAEPVAADNAFIDNGFIIGVSQAGEVANRIDIGNSAGATGTLSITGGDLAVGSGGDFPSIRVGQFAGSTGTLNMSGGTVTVTGGTNNNLAQGDLMIGDLGAGTMLMTGGLLTVSDEIVVGTGNGSVGVLTVNGGTLTNGFLNPASGTGRSIIAGFSGGSNGTINIGGTGVVTIRFDVLLGLIGNSTGTLNLSEGGTLNANLLFSSPDPAATSVINHTGGTFNTLNGFVIGQRGQSTYNLSGGVMNAANFVSVGDDSANAVLNITGGTINTGGELLVSVFAPSNGTINQSAGVINVGIPGVRSGTVSVSRDGALGTYNMSGGTLNADRVFLGDYDSTLGIHNVSGGAIVVRGDYSVGGALASNAPADADRTGDQGQALDAKGILVVHGSASTISIAGDFYANPADKTRPGAPNAATLVFEILNASGTSLINVGSAADLDGAVVDMDLVGYTPANGQVFDLLLALGGIGGDTGTGTTKVNGSTGEAFALAAEDVGIWSLRIVPGAASGSEILQAVFLVPEPASLALLAGVSLLSLRRRA